MLSRLERLLAELKRRHVLRMGGLYLVGAWAVIQVAATTFPFLGLPAWTVTVVIVLAALGLPGAIALAWVFDLTAEGVQRDESGMPREAPSRAARRSRVLIAGLVLVLFAAGAFAALQRMGGRASDLDANLAAVMPFRVVGGEASTEGLGEGMVDLLAMRLSSESGVRAAAARSAISAWTRVGGEQASDPAAAATAAARALGAGRVITGSLVISGKRVTMGATLLRTDLPRARPQTENVTGSLDSLLYLIDSLTLALLAREAGLDQHRLGGLTSLPALQAFLAGKAAHRRGQYAEAIAHYQKSLEADSTFALAALALSISARRTPIQFGLSGPALELAFRHSDRLGERDRALLRAFSPRHPAPPSILQLVSAFEGMLARWPDDADAWFELGDQLLHYGRASDIENSVARSEGALSRALAIDSSFYLPLEHLVVAELEQGDLSQVRLLAPRLLEIGADAARIDFWRWRVAVALGDSLNARAVIVRLDSVNTLSRHAIEGEAQWLGERVADAERAVAITRARAATTPETRDALIREHDLAMNRGMLRRAHAALEQLPPPTTDRDILYLEDALFWDGDPQAAEAAANRLRTIAHAPASDTMVPSWRRAQLHCELAWWNLARERADLAARDREDLRAAVTDAQSPFSTDDLAYCAALIEMWIAALQQRGDVSTLIQRADSINIQSSTAYWLPGNLITARLKERTGDLPGALVSLRRVMLGAPDINKSYISTHLREVARLALLQGDSTLARDYYRRYVGLRARADSALRPDLARARAELARITGEASTR
jgi:tetratricopeptide (TPR) repeat protein/TolB-like protein